MERTLLSAAFDLGVVVDFDSDSLGRRDHGIVRQPENGHLLSFNEPVEVFPVLPNPYAQQRVPEGIVAVPRVALKPVPILGASSPIYRNIKRAKFMPDR